MGAAMITIRPMGLDDLAEVVGLETANQPRPWTEQIFRDELGADNRTYLVAGYGVVVGFGGVMVVGDEAHITNLLVDPDHRGRGVGRSLMVMLIEAAIADGARHSRGEETE